MKNELDLIRHRLQQTIEYIDDLLIEADMPKKDREIRLKILNYIEDNFGVTYQQMNSKNRKQDIVWARFLFYKAMKHNTKLNLAKIAAEFSQTHANVLHGFGQIESATTWRKEWLNEIDNEFCKRAV